MGIASSGKLSTRRFRFFALLAVTAALVAHAANRRLRTLDIVARDGRGTAVGDLRMQELRVFDAGREQQLVYFRRGQDVTAGGVPEKWSNYRYGTFPHVVVVLLDQLNSNLEFSGPDWDQVNLALARDDWEPNAYLYLLLKNGTLYPVRGLPHSGLASDTYPRSWLHELLPRFEGMRREKRERPADLDWSGRNPARQSSKDMVKRIRQATTTAYSELAAALAGVPGTTAIVWIGPEQPVIANPAGPIATRSNPVPIYPVPSRGSAGPPDIQKTIALAFASSERGYRLGYYPPDANWDGRYHELRVLSKRRGIRIQAQAGYTAVRPVDLQDDRRQDLPDLTAAIPFDASTIRFTAVTAQDAAGMHFDLQVNAQDILFESSGGTYTCSLAVQGLENTRDGDAGTPEQPLLVRPDLTAAQLTKLKRDGLRIRLNIKASKGGARYRIAVLDRVTQSFGTLTVDTRGPHQ